MDNLQQLEFQIADLEVKFEEIKNSLISLHKRMKELVKSQNKDSQNNCLDKSLKAKNQIESYYQSEYQSEETTDNKMGYFD